MSRMPTRCDDQRMSVAASGDTCIAAERNGHNVSTDDRLARYPWLKLIISRTLLPVLMPLAPATTLARRFPAQLALVLKEHGIAADFIAQEV